MNRRTFDQFARYNCWANARLYAAVLALSDRDYRRSTGVFFGSLRGTLNHLLTADRIWLHRLTGEGDAAARLDTILHDDRRDLARARLAEDRRLLTVIGGYADADFGRVLNFHTTTGVPQSQPIGEILLHMFNHQTHHRGQAHACLSILTGAEPPSLDMLLLQRGVPAPDLDALLQ